MSEAVQSLVDTAREPLLTIGEVSELLNISPSSVSRLSKSGEIPCVRLKRSVRFSPAVIRHLIEGSRVDAAGGAA